MPDDTETADEFIHKLKKIEDFGDFSDDAMKAMMGMFNQLQLCHDNTAKLMGYMSQLTKTLQPAQFTCVMKHSLCPLIQLSIPPHLCSTANLKFDKLRLTQAERKEEHAMNMMLPRPYHPSLASLPPKHATCALAAIIHALLRKHVFNSKESPNTICEQFQITPKKLYEGMTGKRYDPGVKLTKAEKQQKEVECLGMETQDLTPKKQKMTQQGVKQELQEAKSNNEEPQEEAPKEKTQGDDDDMPMLISDEDNQDDPQQSTFKKPFSRKKTTGPRLSSKK